MEQFILNKPIHLFSCFSDLLTCNFHNDFCKWTQSTKDQFDWSRTSGATKSSGTGPRAPSMAEDGYQGMSIPPLKPVDSYIYS